MMENIIEVDFRNKCREVIYTEEDAEIWNYTEFYAEQVRLGYDKGYNPNNFDLKLSPKLD